MSNESLIQRVQRLEQRYSGRRPALRRNLYLWLLLGYAVFIGTTAILFALSGCAFYFGVTIGNEASWFLIVVGGILLALAVAALFTLATANTPPPNGTELTRTTAPRLFEMLDELQRKIVVPPFQQVWLVSDLNAFVSVRPRIGVFGWSTYHLGIGLMLLEAFSREEVRAILAHEFAHYSRKHMASANHVNQVKRLWMQLFQDISDGKLFKDSPGIVKMFQWFLRWFWPRFQARALVLSREEEFDADITAAQYTSPAALADALWTLECLGSALNENFWPKVWRRAATDDDPPAGVYTEQRRFLEQPGTGEEQFRWMETTCKELTSALMNHPAFAERIGRLGFTAQSFIERGFPRVEQRSGIGDFLTLNFDELLYSFSEEWREQVASEWKRQHDWGRARHRFATIDATLQTNSDAVAVETTVTPLQIAQKWSQIQATHQREGFAASETLLRAFITAHPAQSRAQMLLGRELVQLGRDEGVTFLRKLLSGTDDSLVAASGELLMEHFRKRGQLEELTRVQQDLDRYEQHSEVARKAEHNIGPKDQFVSHDLTAEEFEVFSKALQTEPDLSAAWLVRKQIPHFPDRKVFVLVVQSPSRVFWGSSAEVDQQLVSKLSTAIQLPGRKLVIAPTGAFRKVALAVMKLPIAKVDYAYTNRKE